MKIKLEILRKIDGSNTVKGMICDLFKKSHQTVQRWIDENDIMLTTIGVLKIIKEEFGIDYDKAVEERKETAKA